MKTEYEIKETLPEPHEFEQLELNMGPQHPSTHGVLRLLLTLDSEVIVKATAHVGYLHRSFEKFSEGMTYVQFLPFTDRLDYVSAITNEVGYCLAVEKLMAVEVPRRAQYLRVVASELQRIASHLVFVATMGTDLAAVTVFLYGFRDREKVLDILESLSGQRLTYHYLRIGGVAADVPPGFDRMVFDLIEYLTPRLEEMDELFTDNVIFRRRTEGVGILTAEQALDFGVSGPNLRGSGVAWDVRKVDPYSSYEDFDFEIPTGKQGDCFDRYAVRMQEMRQSLRILRQAIEGLPEGELRAKVPRTVRPPTGEAYAHVEGARGDVGFFIVSDGSANPYRVKIRGPSFVHVMALENMLKGWMIADVIAILGSIDIVLGEVDR